MIMNRTRIGRLLVLLTSLVLLLAACSGGGESEGIWPAGEKGEYAIRRSTGADVCSHGFVALGLGPQDGSKGLDHLLRGGPYVDLPHVIAVRVPDEEIVPNRVPFLEKVRRRLFVELHEEDADDHRSMDVLGFGVGPLQVEEPAPGVRRVDRLRGGAGRLIRDEVVDGSVATYNVRGDMQRVDGKWRLATANEVQRWEGVAGCALAE